MALVGFTWVPVEKCGFDMGHLVANLPKVRFCYRVVVEIPGRTSVPILNLSTPPPGLIPETITSTNVGTAAAARGYQSQQGTQVDT